MTEPRYTQSAPQEESRGYESASAAPVLPGLQAATPEELLVAEGDTQNAPLDAREPHGFAAGYLIGSFGLFLAITAPLVGGLSVRIQDLVGLRDAGTQLGLVTGIGAFVALIAQPIFGRLSDRTVSRFGMRRPWIVAGGVIATVSLVMVGFAPNILVLTVAWCVAQASFNAVQAAMTVAVADQVPKHRLGFISSLIGIASPVALVAASFGLAVLPNDLLRAVIPAVIALACFLYFSVILKDRVLATRPPRASIKEVAATFAFNPVVHRDMAWVWVSRFLVWFSYSAVFTYLTLFLGVNFGMSPEEQLDFNLWAQIVSAIVTVVVSILGGKLSDRIGRRRLFVAGGGMGIGVGALLMLAAPTLGAVDGLVLLLVAQALIGAGAGLYLAVDGALAIEVLPDATQAAKDLGVLNIAAALPQSVAPFLAGIAFIPLGNAIWPDGGYPLWFAFAGLIGVVGALVIFRVKGAR